MLLLGLLATLGPPVLEPDLHARLGQVDLQSHLLAHENVRIAGFAEEGLENVELRAGEGGPFAALLATGVT